MTTARPFQAAAAGLVLAASAATAAVAADPVPAPGAAVQVAVDEKSLYRPGLPPVLTPKTESREAETSEAADAEAIIEAFGRAYRDSKRPKIAVYWNRTLSDRVSQWFATQRVTRGDDTKLDLKGPGGTNTLDMATSETAAVQRLRTDPPRSGMIERISWEFETAYYHPFLDGGARLVDRGAILRLTASGAEPGSGKGSASELDIQVIESRALQAHADLLMEVLLAADSKAPLGLAFRVVLKDIATGEVLGSVFSGRPPPPTEEEQAAKRAEAEKVEYVPGPGGFVPKLKRGEAEPTPAEVGRRLALDAMVMATAALRRP